MSIHRFCRSNVHRSLKSTDNAKLKRKKERKFIFIRISQGCLHDNRKLIDFLQFNHVKSSLFTCTWIRLIFLSQRIFIFRTSPSFIFKSCITGDWIRLDSLECSNAWLTIPSTFTFDRTKQYRIGNRLII